MIKQGNMFQYDITELTAIERNELEMKRRNEVLSYLGISQQEKKRKKKLRPVPVTKDKYIRTYSGIFQADYIMDRFVIVRNLKTGYALNVTYHQIINVASDPYDLLQENDLINVKVGCVIRECEIYKVFYTKDKRIKFMVMDTADGEVTTIDKMDIYSIKYITTKERNNEEIETEYEQQVYCAEGRL